MKTYCIYARKSSESEDRQLLSIDSQIDELTRLAEREGIVIDKVFRESKSAKAPGRPVFNEMMGQISRKKIDGVICWKLDRLARNPVDGGQVIWSMDEGKLKTIVTPFRRFEKSGDDAFFMQLEFGMAKKYVDDLSVNVKRGLRAKVSRGEFPGTAPQGYINDKNTSTIIPDPDRFETVKKLWKLALKGVPARDICLKANGEWGFKTKVMKSQGGTPLSTSSLYRILHNPFYYGALRFKGELYPGIHQPMVTKKEFDTVQTILAQRTTPRPQVRQFSFTGVMTCGECGCSITAEQHIKPSGRRYVYYRCTKKRSQLSNQKCSQGYVSEDVLNSQILDILSSIQVPQSLLSVAVDVMNEGSKQRSQERRLLKGQLEKRMSECIKKISGLTEMRLRDLIDDDEFTAKKNEVVSEKVSIQHELDTLDSVSTRADEECLKVFELATRLKEAFATGSVADKKTILTTIGSNYEVREKNLQFKPKKPFSFLIPSHPSHTPESPKKGLARTSKNGSTKSKTESLDSVCCSRLALVNQVRTHFLLNI